MFTIQDDDEVSIMGAKHMAIFPPKVLLSKLTLTAGIPILHIDRPKNGIWNITVQLMAPGHITKFWTIYYTVTNFDKENVHQVQFTARPASHNTTKYQAENELKLACQFTDSDVNRIATTFNNPETLFQIKVKMVLDKTFAENVSDIAGINIANQQATPFPEEGREGHKVVFKGQYRPFVMNENDDEYIP